MIAFIDDHREAYGVEPICKVLPIASSTYHPSACHPDQLRRSGALARFAHVARRADPGKQPARTRSDAALMIDIRRVFETNFCVYGVRKSLPPRRRGSGGSSAGRGSRWHDAPWLG